MSITFLYAIGPIVGPVKLGISRNPFKRLVQIQTACPFTVRLLHAQPCESFEAAKDDERFLHKFYRDQGLHMCGEWFNIVGRDGVQAVRDAVSSGLYFRKSGAST